MREDHLLHDHGHVDRPVVDAVAQAVGHGPLGEQRRPAPADVLEDRRRPHDVQVRVLLAGEGGRRQVLCRRAGSHGVGGLLAEPGERAGDRRREIVRDGDPFDGPADLRAERADRLPVVRVQARQLIEPIVDRRRFRHDPPEGVRRHAEAGRHADAFDPRQLPQVRALAADDRDLRLVNLLKIQHVLLDHCDTSEAAVLRRTAPADRITGASRSVEPLVGHVPISRCLPSDKSAGRCAPGGPAHRTCASSAPNHTASPTSGSTPPRPHTPTTTHTRTSNPHSAGTGTAAGGLRGSCWSRAAARSPDPVAGLDQVGPVRHPVSGRQRRGRSLR